MIITIIKIIVNNKNKNTNNIKNNGNNLKHKAKFMSNMSFEGRKLSFSAILLHMSLREKIQMQSYFWSIFFCIWTE